MSSRDPLWFCHECHAEMRPLMVPDPICASCHGGFVEKMDEPADDPREFAHSPPTGLEGEGFPPGIDTFLLGLQALVDRGPGSRPRSPPEGPHIGRSGGPSLTFQIRTGPNQQGPDSTPTMSQFIRRGPDAHEGSTITGQLMAQYLMALLGNRDPLNDLFGAGMHDLTSGRMGDYVFNQEALDHIITQLMENSNAHRPVPATEEVVGKLDREVLEEGSPLLEKDCAVCKEQFKLQTEDPDEQVVVSLPCKHPFHEPCILPWLKSSGTCPVCRHALVPQPEQSTPPSSSRTNSFSNSSRNRSPRQSPPRDSHGIFQSLFGSLVGGGSDATGRGPSSSSGHNRSSSDPASRSSDRRNTESHFPGGWQDDLD